MAARTVDPQAVADSVAVIRQRLRDLAGDREIQLVAVTKGFGADAVRAATAAGCTMVGENYAQELIAKVAVLRSEDAIVPQVHFIGQLQTNKVRQIAGIVDVWQSVDRTALIDEIVRRAPGAKVFVQVNSTEEDGKGGCSPADVGSLVQRCRAGGLGVEGLMTIGPTSQDGSETKRAFMLVRGLADDNGLTGCSMGMSDDMAIAVESGATHVRIGSAIFGTRPHPQTRIG